MKKVLVVLIFNILFSSTLLIGQPLSVNLTTDPVPDTTWCDCSCGYGVIHANVSGGTPPYTYLWSEGSTSGSVFGLMPGVYTVTVTDAVSASVTDSYTISYPSYFWDELCYIAPTPGECNGLIYFYSACGPGGCNTPVQSFPPTLYPYTDGYAHAAPICDGNGNFIHQVATSVSGCMGLHSGVMINVDNFTTGPCYVSYVPPIQQVPCTSNTRFEIINMAPLQGTAPWGILFDNNYFGPPVARLFDLQGNLIATSPYFYDYMQNNFSSIIDFGINISGTVIFDYHEAIVDGDTLGIQLRDTFSIFQIDCGEFNGRIYYDSNGDCVFNSGTDLQMPNTYLNFQPGNFNVITNDSGEFVANLPFNTYTVTQSNPYGFSQSCPVAPLNITLDAVTPTINMDIGNDSGNPNCDNDVLIIGSASRPGFITKLIVDVKNNNIQTSDLSTLTLNFDPLLQFVSAEDAGVNNGSTVTWNVPAIIGFSGFRTSVELQVPAGVSIGTILNHIAFVSASACDTILVNDTTSYQKVVTGSFDPNDKSASPVGAGPLNLIPIDQNLIYTIRFQNTGNDYAENVVLIDTLSPQLDLSTLKMEMSSHNCFLELESPGTLVVRYPNIMLPDSALDPEGSKGYFVYSISPLPGLTEGTVIENNAGIYFDYNAPIITNTVAQTLSIGPVALCQNVQIFLDTSGNASLSSEMVDAGSADFFGLSSVSLSDSLFTCTDMGVQQVTLYATSVNNETDSCTATITVIDSIAPVALTINSNIYLDASGQAILNAQMLDGGSTDNCSTITSSVIPLLVDCSLIGVVAATVTFTDASLNMSSAISQLNVLDTIAPSAICHDTILFVDSTCFVAITPLQIDNGSTDNCGISQINLSQSTFTCADVGSNSIIFSVTDASGNVSQCISQVTIIDVTGINEISDSNQFFIIPNPSSGIIQLPPSSTGSSLSVYDIAGKLIFYNEHLKSTSVDLSNSPSGSYFVKLAKGERVYYSKWVKIE